MSTAMTTPQHKGLESPGSYELKITRVFDAPRDLVWKAWTDPAMQMQWMGPRGFVTTELEMPKTPGSPWRRTMEGLVPAKGTPVKLKQHGTLREVRPPELMVFSFAWDVPSDVGLSNMDFQENTITVRLEEQGNKTLMTFTQGPFLSAGACMTGTPAGGTVPSISSRSFCWLSNRSVYRIPMKFQRSYIYTGSSQRRAILSSPRGQSRRCLPSGGPRKASPFRAASSKLKVAGKSTWR